MRRLKIDNLDTQLRAVVDSTLNGVLFASLLRYFALGGALFKFVTDAGHENVVSGLILFTISILMHYTVCPYMGFRLFSYRRINRPDEFIPLRDWMIPGFDIEELFGRQYQSIMDVTTKQEHLKLKQKREINGIVTMGDFVNLMLLRLQCENQYAKNSRTNCR